MKTKTLTQAFRALFIVITGTLLMTGCETFNDDSTSELTSVTIKNHSLGDVQNAVASVFAAHGFNGGQTGAQQFTYTRPGSDLDQAAYGSYMFKETVTVKVIVDTIPQESGDIMVGCRAWLVEGAGDPLMQDAHKVHSIRSYPYRQLLDEVKKQLGE